MKTAGRMAPFCGFTARRPCGVEIGPYSVGIFFGSNSPEFHAEAVSRAWYHWLNQTKRMP